MALHPDDSEKTLRDVQRALQTLIALRNRAKRHLVEHPDLQSYQAGVILGKWKAYDDAITMLINDPESE